MNIRTPLVLLATVAVLAGFVAFNVLLGATVRGVRADLTAGRIYTLSEGVKPLLQRLPEPVKLDLFYSEDAGRGIPAVATYAQRVREFLEELVSASGGMLSLRVVDPLPYSEAEDEAVAAGLAALSVDGAGRSLTFGLVATNSVDQRQAIPFLDPSKEPFLEYEILRLIESVGRAKKARLGVLSTLPISGSLSASGDPRRPPAPTPPWQIDLQLRELFEVVEVQPEDEALPEGIDLLLLIQPRGLSEPLLRAIDAHALRGGRLLAFLDPYCDHAEIDPQLAQLGIAGALSAERSFDLGALPKAWGIEIPADRVVGDRTFALQVQTSARGDGRGGPRIVPYLPFLGVDERGLDRDDPITGALELVVMTTVGAIDLAKTDAETPGSAAGPELTPLIQSSPESMRIETAMIAAVPDPAALLSQFAPSGVRERLAVKIGGTIRSAFDGPQPVGESATVSPAAPAAPSAPAAIIVVADADLLADENWIVEERLGSMSLGARTVADNGAFVLNALEMLSGDSAMLSLRSRGKAARGFERVEEIRKSAEERYLARERELEEQIDAAQQKISDLQRTRPRDGDGPGAGPGQLILSPEQEQQLETLERNVLAARKELREVQFNLRADYERLGTRLMVVNVVAWPLMVALGAMAWFVHRGHRVRKGGAR